MERPLIERDVPREIVDIALEINAVIVKYGFHEVLTALLMNLDDFLESAIDTNPMASTDMKIASSQFRRSVHDFKYMLWEAILKQNRPQ